MKNKNGRKFVRPDSGGIAHLAYTKEKSVYKVPGPIGTFNYQVAGRYQNPVPDSEDESDNALLKLCNDNSDSHDLIGGIHQIVENLPYNNQVITPIDKINHQIVKTYTCQICGADFPSRFTLNTSYGHVCLGCSNKLYDTVDTGGSIDLSNPILKGKNITNDMINEICNSYKAVVNDLNTQHSFSNFCFLALHIILDIEDESGRWQDAYDEVVADYFDAALGHNEIIAPGSFSQEEIKSFVKSIVEKRIEILGSPYYED